MTEEWFLTIFHMFLSIALDETTEEKLFAAIKDQLKNKLVIMITHCPKNLIYTDEIIELKK